MATAARQRLRQFAEMIAHGQHLPQQRFIADALRGLHISQDVMLSAWGRCLRESQNLFYTEKRLSNGLRSKRLDDTAMRAATLDLAAPLVAKHCDAISIDTTDLSKPYATKMPFMCRVHDGSKGNDLLGKPAVGYGWMVLRADGVALNGRHIPLHFELYSRAVPEYRSENDHLRTMLEAIRKRVPRTTPFIFDAGYDGRSTRRIFAELGIRTTLRLVDHGPSGKRELAAGDTTHRLHALVEGTPARTRFRISTFTQQARRSWLVGVGWHRGVRFVTPRKGPEAERYSLVVVRYAHKSDAPSMVLLTTDDVRTEVQARAVVERYFSRWAVEDGHRLLKERFRLENARVMTWHGLKRLAFLAHVAYLHMAWLVYVANGEELARGARAFRSVPKFPYYRISDALAEALAGHG